MALAGTFSWEFLVWLAAFGVISILFLFYSNRIFASIVSWVISIYTWHFYRVSIHIQALQLSPLGGRIFFKGVRYHGQNETILVHDGFITWRYWYRRVRDADATRSTPLPRRTAADSDDDSPPPPSANEGRNSEESVKHDLPCRFLMEVRGVEWFVYNRKPAYDSVLATLLNPHQSSDAQSESSGFEQHDSRKERIFAQTKSESSRSDAGSNVPKNKDTGLSDANSGVRSAGSPAASIPPTNPTGVSGSQKVSEPQLPTFLQLLPIGIKCSHAGMVMGNEYTRSVLVAKISNFEGIVNARPAGPQDQYRQCFEFDASTVSVQFKHNHDYLETQINAGRRAKKQSQAGNPAGIDAPWTSKLWQSCRSYWRPMMRFSPFHAKSNSSLVDLAQPRREHATSASGDAAESSANRWLGLSRYLKDDGDGSLEQERWKAIEYGRSETIVDCPKMIMNFFWDVPGPIPPDRDSEQEKLELKHSANINGDVAPAYGLELEIGGGTINYGPWADRQRADLQAVFFPASYATLAAAQTLKPGQSRVSTKFNIVITLQEKVTLRLHTREESKDWRWKHQSTKPTASGAKKKSKAKKRDAPVFDPENRPAGWMDLTVGADSCVTYSMDMVPGGNGYHNGLKMSLKSTEMSSSVNHDLMWRCEGASLSCTLPNPLTWNALRKWHFDILIDRFELFIIRDHAFLLTDLINDWTSGPPGEFFAFVPFVYSLSLTMPNFKLYLNVNDSNIIDSPTSLDDNVFIVLWGDKLIADIGIPMDNFRPSRNKVTFDVDTTRGGLRLLTPLWSTQRTFLKNDSVGSFEGISVRGSYNYYTTTSPALTDTVLLDVSGSAPCVSLYGFLVRYFMNFKENYFGEDLHFQTKEEYQQQIGPSGDHKAAGHEQHSPTKPTNDLDVILTISANENSILLPSNLYTASENIKIDIASLAADLRFTNYYMDLQVNFSPLTFARGYVSAQEDKGASTDSNTQAFIDGLTISGHRLFGLPPTEPTYVCNWDFGVGRVSGECTVDFLTNVIGAARAFAFSFADAENALPRRNPLILHDVTFLRAKVCPIKLWLHVDSSAFLLDTDVITVDFNDWAGERFSERLHLAIPRLAIACIDGRSASRHRMNSDANVPTYAYISSSVDLRTMERKAHFEEQRRLQQEHIAFQDSRTYRTPWLLHNTDPSASARLHDIHHKPRPPASTFPPMPEPLKEQDSTKSSSSSRSSRSDTGKRRARGPSSFISLGSLQRSHQSSKPSKYSNSPDSNQSGGANFSPTTTSPNLAEAHKSKRNGLASTTIAFSSPFETPYFPLQHVHPNTADVPACVRRSWPINEVSRELVESILPANDSSLKHTTVLLRFEDGLQGLCTPEALFHINSLVSSLQAASPDDLLDELQTAAISETLSRKRPSAAPMLLEVRAQLPAMAIRLQSQASNYSNNLERRVYDVNLDGLIVTARKHPSSSIGNQHGTGRSALHTSLNKISCIATGALSSSANDQARIEASLNAAVLWLVQGDSLSGGLQYDELKLTNSNRQVEQLASLVNSTLILGDSLSRSFRETALIHKDRLRALVYFLSTSQQSIEDPTFLTSTSYTLRTTTFHPRNDDSWKLVSRLRHVSNQIPAVSQRSAIASGPGQHRTYPHDARQKVLVSFNKWRAWDLTDANASSFMNIVFGSVLRDSNRPSKLSVPLSFSLRAGVTQIIIDPGPGQNEFGVESFVLAVESKISNPDRSTGSRDPAQHWILQLSAAETKVLLNWGICELLESILKQYLESPTLAAPSTVEMDFSDQQRSQIPFTCQIAGAFEVITTSFETINFKASSRFVDLASSVLLRNGDADALFVTGLASTTSIVSEISGLHQQIVQCRLDQPSLHVGLESLTVGKIIRKTWKCGGLCRQSETSIREDALGLLGVADIFIRDEMAYIKRIDQEIIQRLRNLPRKAETPKPEATISHAFHVALLLEEYTISVKLLSSLTYSMKGNTAQSTLRSKDDSQTNFALDFDIEDHKHSFTNYGGNTEQEVFEITLPPVNGQLLPTKEENRVSVSASIAIQKVHIHASEIHALFTTLSRTEMATFKQNVMRDLALVKSNWRSASWATVEPPRSKTAPFNVDTVFVYDARLTIAGLHVKASSSRSSKLSADLTLDVGCFHVDVNNESDHQEALDFPEIGASLQHVAVLLKRSDRAESYPCGDMSFTASFRGTSHYNDEKQLTRSFEITTDDFEVNVYPETASSIVDILGYLQQRFKSFNLSEEINTFRARRLRSRSHATPLLGPQGDSAVQDEQTTSLFSSMYSLDINYVQLSWHVGSTTPISPGHDSENLVFSISKIALETRKANSARLMLKDLQLQMVPSSQSTRDRSLNSALLPEVVFNVAYLSSTKDRRLAFQAVGRTLGLRLTSQFILPAAELQKSIGIATEELRKVVADWNAAFVRDEQQNKTILGNKTLSSVLVDIDFAGAEVHIQGTRDEEHTVSSKVLGLAGKIPGLASDNDKSMVLSAPGVALKVEYKNLVAEDPSLSAEIKVNASSNTLHPTVVPLILEMSESVKTVVGDQNTQQSPGDIRPSPSKPGKQEQFDATDPTAILGNCRLNIGLRICKQDFGLTCQPIARVAATAKFEDIYITVNTVQAPDQHRFFALTAIITSLESSVQHVYSREKTGSFSLDSINLSLMNSRHVSETEGLSAILKISPMKININAKQLHDFFLFQEIWLPADVRQSSNSSPVTNTMESSQIFGVQRYQQMAAAGAFPWNASIAITSLDIRVDLGQSLGKTSLSVTDFWVSSKKSSDFHQNLCLGFNKIGIESSGRMSGFIELRAFRLQTSIHWPVRSANETPLIEASLGFDDLRAKAAFEYQMFLIADFSSLEFLMYNVRDANAGKNDRLVCTVEGDKVHMYCTTQSAAQVLGLYQAVQRLVQEKRTAYEQSLRDVEKYLRRKSAIHAAAQTPSLEETNRLDMDDNKTPIKLQTNVVVSLKAVKIGAYPSTFFDSQIFKVEALDASAKFSVALHNNQVESALGLQLGQVRIALSSNSAKTERKTLEDLSVEEVVNYSAGSRGGTILKVPRVVATMQAYQKLGSTQIDYIFKSSFEGKVEVGWNYSRISYIRGMFEKHSRTLAHRLGKPLPQSAVQITGGPRPETSEEGGKSEAQKDQEKITAVVNVPLSKYSYTALEPPVIVTPQLRDMGEATPPLEWIGLHRDRLPNLTHQVIIVPLLEVAKEVEDAYSRILGS